MARLPEPLRLSVTWTWIRRARAAGGSAAACFRPFRSRLSLVQHWKPAVLLAGTGLGLSEYCKRPTRCEESEVEWWKNPAQCSDASTLWQRAWNADWDGRAPPTSSPSVKTTGQIRHLLFIRHGQYNLDDDEHGLPGLEC